MSCGIPNPASAVAWFKNGKRISETSKTKISQGNLYILCLELLDSGEYVCKDKSTLSYIDSHSLDVKNQENKSYFHIYNQFHQKCVSKIGKRLFVTRCDVNNCAQKWSLTPCKKIISAHNRGNPECISVRRLVKLDKIIMEPCQSTTSFKRWECKDGDLLSIQGEQLYFNYGNLGNYIVLWPRNRAWSRWVKYSTGRPLCDEELDLKDTSTQGHWSPSVPKKSTKSNKNTVLTPTLEHSSVIQVTRVSNKIKSMRISKMPSKNSNVGIIAGPVIAAIIVFFFFLVVFFMCMRKKLNQRFLMSFQEAHQITHQARDFKSSTKTNHSSAVDPQTSLLENQEEIPYIQVVDDWEIRRENLTILEKKLGCGQFGVVKQGILFRGKNESEVFAVKILKDTSIRHFSKRRSDSEIVAVKMLKDGATAMDKSDFLRELKILKEVNKYPHPNILQLIGACSTTEPQLLVTEYCFGGNLRTFLLNSRVELTDDSKPQTYRTTTITHEKRLKFAIDAASGMIHLASQKFIHRDLAARNILLAANDTAKLSDFGLARNITDTEVYIRSNQNLLPLKWMAVESLLNDRFTTSSDIWSFGVLLYEIATLGDEPYKGMASYNVVSQISSGYRMEKPPQCSDQLYTLMRNCWKVNPDERPSFEEIHNTLNHMLTDDEHSLMEGNVMQIKPE